MSWYDVGPDYSFHGAHNWFVGGDATKGIDTQLGGYATAQNQLGQISQAQAPQANYAQLGGAYQLDPYQMQQSRAGMMGVANNLGAVASGQQAGAGELAVNRQTGQATAEQQAAAHGVRGANAALAYRQAMRNTADIGQAGAGQAAQAQMQDQQAANAQLGQLYGGMYGQDAGVAAQNAQLGQQAMLQQGQFQQQTNLANQQATLQSRALQIQALGEQRGWSQAQIDEELKRASIEASDKGILSGIFSGMSDERTKTDIADGGDDADELMSKLKPRRFRFRDEHAERWGKGEMLGFMAQDLARSKMGAKVIASPDGEHLGFDVVKATGAALASVARLHERLAKLEVGELRLGERAAGRR